MCIFLMISEGVSEFTCRKNVGICLKKNKGYYSLCGPQTINKFNAVSLH